MRLMRHLIVTAAVLVMSAAVLPAQPKKLDPCTLVAKPDVQEAVGANVADPTVNQHNAAVCDFKVGGYGSVSFMVNQVRPGEPPEKIMAELKKRNIPVTEAKGIGDRAFFASPGYGMIQLNAFKGPHYIIVTMLVPGAPEARQKAAAEKLMTKALAKL